LAAIPKRSNASRPPAPVSRNPVDFGAISVGKVAGPLNATLQNSVDADVVISPAQARRKKPRTMRGLCFPLT